VKRRLTTYRFLAGAFCALLLCGCTPGVSGGWFIAGAATTDLEERAATLLQREGFTEWKPSQEKLAVDGVRFFGDKRGLGALTRKQNEGIGLEFQEDFVERLSPEGARVFLNIEAALRREFGAQSVSTIRVPRGLKQIDAS